MQINDIRVSVIIPNYNGIELLKKNLPSVFLAKKYKLNRISEIIIVDDASSDRSFEFVKRNYPDAKLVRHKVNRGFSAAINTGVRASKGEIVVLLNNDVSPTKNFLVKTLPHFKKEEVFAVSFCEKGYSFAKGKFVDGFLFHSQGDFVNKTKETFWVNGGSGAFRRDYFIKLGGMDEKLLSPFYWEDVDICYRAYKRGWICLWEPRSLVFHEHGSTISKISLAYRERIQERNELIFLWKNLTSSNLFRKHLFGLLKRIYKHPGYIKIVFLALTKIRGILKARKKEKKESVISDEAIFAKFSD